MGESNTMSSSEYGKNVLRIEADALRRLVDYVDISFDQAVDMLFSCKGRIILTGMGKPGLIGRKIAATMASTGSPSMFLHPAEAIHGDLGMVTANDVVLAISHSGETQEVVKLLETIKRIGAQLISLTGNLNSTLAKNSDVSIHVYIDKEACPLGLAPTASTTAQLAMGDALALALLEKRGFKEEDFALYHPGGSLGKKLLIVKEIMRKGEANPIVHEDVPLKDVLLLITQSRAGCCTVVDDKGILSGIFTDGDLRRHFDDKPCAALADEPVKNVMTPAPLNIHEDKLAVEAICLLREKKIDELPVVNSEGMPVGLLDIQDLLKAGLV